MARGDTQPVGIRRRNYIIDRKFQSGFILRFCLLVVAAGLFILAVLYLISGSATSVSYVNSRIVVQSTADYLLPLLIQTFAIAVIIVGVATVFLTVLISHRIAGPAYRFKQVLSSLGKRDFSGQCRIRRKDYLQDVAFAMNDMMASVRKALAAVDGSLARLKSTMESATNGAGGEGLKALKKELAELENILRGFKF
jgi:methyl-accepting chemotaxis protein